MKRRDFLQLTAIGPLLALAPDALAAISEPASDWRTFELTYEIDLSEQTDKGKIWLPLPSAAGDYQRVISTHWHTEADNASLNWDPVYQAPIFSAQWDDNVTGRLVTVIAQVATRHRCTAVAGPFLRSSDEAAIYLQPTEHMPVDGIVSETANKIVKGIDSPDDQARAIYDWIVDNTFRDPAIKGCGMGNIKTMLETGYLGGKCADINSLFVGLARAAGIPARETYGVRVAESEQFQCLGKSGDVSKAQHCRAEYFSQKYGWVPVDPADVRKAVLETELPITDPKIMELRQRLFGYWEMNWVGFNNARDFDLNPKASRPLPYLMYPYAEFGDTRLDGRDPSRFKFKLSSVEIDKQS
ncbi:MAG: transglutaminase-like domain-containing protein [Gammaproteobacteria bacterium]